MCCPLKGATVSTHRNEWSWCQVGERVKYVKKSSFGLMMKEEKTGKIFFTDLTWKYHLFWLIFPFPNLRWARWVILSAAFCFWTILTKVEDSWKQKVEVIHIIRYQSWDWSGAVVLAAVHVREFFCTQYFTCSLCLKENRDLCLSPTSHPV